MALKCIRCREDLGDQSKCAYCGVSEDRPIRKMRRRRPIGGKRGRNSGTVNKAKSK